MTTSPLRRTEVKIRRTVWVEADHPRDRKGRFIETGAEVRIWGGWLGRVIRNLGGGRIEVARINSDGSLGEHVSVHRNYLTVTKRPDGSAPTDKQDANPAALPETTENVDVPAAPEPTAVPETVPTEHGGNLYDTLHDRDPAQADLVRQAASDYQDALHNGTPGDEADERDGLLAVLNEVEHDHGDDPAIKGQVDALREAATALPAEVAAPTPEDRLNAAFDAAETEAASAGDAMGAAAVGMARNAHASGNHDTARAMGDVVAVSGRPHATALAATLSAVYSGSNRNGGGPDGRDGDAGAAAPREVPAGGSGSPDGPGGVLPGVGESGAGPDRPVRGPGSGDNGAGGDVPAAGGTPVDGAVDGPRAGDARGDLPSTDTGAAGGDAGGPGPGRGAGGVPDGTVGDAGPSPDAVAPFERGATVYWQNPDPSSFTTTRRGTFSHMGDQPGEAYIDVPSFATRRNAGPTERLRVNVADLHAPNETDPSPAEVEWRTRNEPGYTPPPDTSGADEARNALEQQYLDATGLEPTYWDGTPRSDEDLRAGIAEAAAGMESMPEVTAQDARDVLDTPRSPDAPQVPDDAVLNDQAHADALAQHRDVMDRLNAIPTPEPDAARGPEYANGFNEAVNAAVVGDFSADPGDQSEAWLAGWDDGLAQGGYFADAVLNAHGDPAEMDHADRSATSLTPAAVGSWVAKVDTTNEGVLTITGEPNVSGRMLMSIDGWRGSVNGIDSPVIDEDPQVVLDGLYDAVNGAGRAQVAHREVTAGRAIPPEVAHDWGDLPYGSRIVISPKPTREWDPDARQYVEVQAEPFEGYYVRSSFPSYMSDQGYVTYSPDADMLDVQSVAIPKDSRPVPAAPLLGEEGEPPPLAEDDGPAYEADPSAVPATLDGPRFNPSGIEDFADAGTMTKLDANLAALRTLGTLRAEGRPATPEEQAVLAKWAGWGGLADVFDPTKGAFEARRQELNGLLSPGEMAEARRNTLNAHYTDARVVKALWQAVEDLGHDGGRVLEPGSGSGTFIGFRPEGTDMVGVELDSTTAAISKYLYPDAQVWNESFAETNVPDGAFDGVIGNVPFGRFSLLDRLHNATGESIHNHFILKSLDFTKPGGLVAVLSSRYTLDSESDAARRLMYDQADLVGAIRLPNGSHQRVSGTDVIEDVLIFRKRMPGEEPGDDTWLTSTKRDVNGWNVAQNHYFDQHPDRALGTITAAKGRYGGELRVEGDRDMPDLGARLAEVVADGTDKGLVASPRIEEPATLLSARSGRYAGHIQQEPDGTFTQAVMGASVPFAVAPKQRDQMGQLLGLRDTLNGLLNAETLTAEDTPDIEARRADLNARYDAYVGKYGPLNAFRWSKSGSRISADKTGFRRDPQGAVVRALETYTPPSKDSAADDLGTGTKTAIFTTRAVAPRERRTKADNPADAMTLSMDQYGEVNLPAIASMLDVDEDTARARLGSLVFEVPPLSADDEEKARNAVTLMDADPDAATLGDLAIGAESIAAGRGRLVPAAEYLSGNVRHKMAAARVAAEQDPRYQANVEALRGVIPADLGPDDIDGRLGAAWIPADVVQQFANDMLGLTSWNGAKVVHSGGSIWRVVAPKGSVRSNDTWGTDRKPFGNILQSLLEQRSVEVTVDGKKDLDATLAAQAKAEAIQERFSEWIWENPQRAQMLAGRYNDQFNAIALRKYDGSGRTFEGMSEEWQAKVQPHVKDAVERIVNEPTALLAHVVGAGKTAEMVMGTAELRRLGLARKPAVVVPNHMLEQFNREYLEIYPNAKILTAGQGMSAEDRREFVARAATGDWDAVIMTQGAFEGIPMSKVQQERYIDREMATMRQQLEDARASGDSDSTAGKRTVKAMEAAILRAEQALRKKLDKQKDLGVSFEQTGIDYLMVDEAHEYSNLRTLSAIQGAGAMGSDMATDLHMKMEFLRETSRSGRVATFATGTPIRNTVTQAYIMVKYLRPDLLEESGIHSFDQWAATFGSVVDEMELKPEGTGFRTTSRFAKFRNVPEFLRMFHTFADVKMAEDLNLPRPNLEGGQAQTIAVPRSDALAEYISALGDRADDVRSGQVDPTVDNMLKISTDGRKAALSMALVQVGTDDNGQPIYGDHEPGKIEAAADRIGRIYQDNKDKVYTDPKTGIDDPTPGALQIVFMDMGTPSGAKTKDDAASVDDNAAAFNGYDTLKAELVARGVPAEKIRYIHEARNDAEKAELFAAARDGRIAVLLGSSQKMGVGTNMQRRAKALHHIDAPWRPADVEQRDGRLHRQGNLHMNMGEDVAIYRYVTEGSFDAYMWQTLERKAKFINQVMRGSLDVREIEDVGDTAMSYAEVKALATGNPDMLEKAKADTSLGKLERLERNFYRTRSNMAAERSSIEARANGAEQTALAYTELLSHVQRTPDGGYAAEPLTPDGTRAVDTPEGGHTRTSLGEAFAARLNAIKNGTTYGDGAAEPVGTYGGLTLVGQSVRNPMGGRTVQLTWADPNRDIGQGPVIASLDQPSPLGVIQRLDNNLDRMEVTRNDALRRGAEMRSELGRIDETLAHTDFPRAAEVAAWRHRADRLGQKIERDMARAKGEDVAYDPAIDSDQFDDPIILGSAEEVAPPEEVPARIELAANALREGQRIEFILGEVSGTMAEGRITRLRTIGDLVFATIQTDDGKTYTRAFEVDALVTKVADPTTAVTGVKGLPRLVLAVQDGRVMAVKVGVWKETLHPRDRNGQFIDKGAIVKIWGGGLGKISRVLSGGRVEVLRDADQKLVQVDAGNVTVQHNAPKAPGVPNVPAAPGVPSGGTPNAPAASGTTRPVNVTANPDGGARSFGHLSPDGQHLGVEDGNGVTHYQHDTGVGGAVGALGDRLTAGDKYVHHDGQRFKKTDQTHPSADHFAASLGTITQDAAKPNAPIPPHLAQLGAKRGEYADVEAMIADNEPLDPNEADALRQWAAANPDAFVGRDAFGGHRTQHHADDAAGLGQPATGEPPNTTPAPDARPDGSVAHFTDDANNEAWLTRGPDGKPVGYLWQAGSGKDPVQFNDPQEWAAYVDSNGFTEPGSGTPLPPDSIVQTRPTTTITHGTRSTSSPSPIPGMGPVESTVPTATITHGSEPIPDPNNENLRIPGDTRKPHDSAADALNDLGDSEPSPAGADQVPTPGLDAALANHGNTGTPDAAGTAEDPIDVQGDLDKAAQLLADGKHIRLNKVDEVGTLLDKLAENAKQMEADGEKAKPIDLCQVSVPGTNLFCQQSQGIPRAEMPQLSGIPTPGSPADGMERNKRGRVDLTQDFLARLEASGIGVTEEDVPAASLKATQNQLNGVAVGGMMQSMAAGTMSDAKVFITRDNYVIDGHHRWAAKVGVDSQDGNLGDVTMPVRRIDMEIGEALDFSNAYGAEMGIQRVQHGQVAGQPPGAPSGPMTPDGAGAPAVDTPPAPATATPDAPGGAGRGAAVTAATDALLASMGNVDLPNTDDNTTIPHEIADAATAYDAAMAGTDVKAKVVAHLGLAKALEDANNALDTGGDEPERKQALDDLNAAFALVDGNVRTLFPAYGEGGTDPGLDGPILDPGAVKDLLAPTRANPGVPPSAAAYLVKGEDGNYRLTVERQALHDAIAGSLLDGVPVSDNPTYNFFGGGPASGKGSITTMFPHLKDGAAYINADEIKAMLPESGTSRRQGHDYGPSMTHEESSLLAKRVQKEGFAASKNVTLDGTGDNGEKGVRKKIDAARAAGYKIDAYYVTVPTEVAQERAVWRAKNGTGADRGRFVPPDVIEETHVGVSQVFPLVADLFDSTVLFDTNVPKGTPPNLIGRKDSLEGKFGVIAPGKWQEFLDKAAGW